MIEKELIVGHWLLQPTCFIPNTGLASMKAKFVTSCISCGGKIQPGNEISKNKDEKWIHKHCIDDSESLP